MAALGFGFAVLTGSEALMLDGLFSLLGFATLAMKPGHSTHNLSACMPIKTLTLDWKEFVKPDRLLVFDPIQKSNQREHHWYFYQYADDGCKGCA